MINAETMEIFRRTRRWTKFVGVGLMVGAIFIITFGLFAIIGSEGVLDAGVFLGIGIVISILFIYPARRLLDYSKASEQLLSSGADSDLCQALDQIRKFWIFQGVIVILVLTIYFGVIIALRFG